MDGYTAMTNWALFAGMAGLGAWYYWPRGKTIPQQKIPLVREAVKKESKRPTRQESYAEKAAKPVPASVQGAPDTKSAQPQANGVKKRKANTQPAIQTTAATGVEQEDDDAIDMSTRQFAEQMRKARQGVDVKQSNSKDTRVKTVKPKNNQNMSSGSSQEGDDDWEPAVVSPTLRSTGVDDMLEPAPQGPNALRITAPTKPQKEKVNKPKKEEVVETKKQRQNRKKREAEKAAIAETNNATKSLQEQQRRTARLARGEPAKNGVPVPAAPVENPWQEQNAAREAQLPAVVSNGTQSQTQLLDTFDVESNSSSNAEVSTAATSIADQGPHVTSGEEDLQKALEESEQETGWTVQSTKKSKKKVTSGDATPVQQPVIVSGNNKTKADNGISKPSGFAALTDELQESPDRDSAWTA
jgi:hypothetical protein